MLYRCQGLPEEDEIVLCKVTKIFPNSVFVDIVEYRKSGMIHISEVSPGRIRNLRDYVVVGKQIVCKVLRVDRQTGHIDLSLRRANSNQRREKLEEIKQELKAEGLVSNLAKKLKIPSPKLYETLTRAIFQEYSHLYLCFKDVVSDDVDLEKLGLDKKVAQELITAIKDKFKPVKIIISGEIRLETYSPNGVEKIRKTLADIQKVSPNLSLLYLGAGRYKLSIEDFDYKPAEKDLKQAQKILEKFNDKVSTATFERK
ncbi:S1 RNA-binding domain-containing protein [Candidatus Woesearchaeota archaeon]|nr:S1 RNA-binding domain-containing protein [Candidatus Woesearchaeota archaeon]